MINKTALYVAITAFTASGFTNIVQYNQSEKLKREIVNITEIIDLDPLTVCARQCATKNLNSRDRILCISNECAGLNIETNKTLVQSNVNQ